MVLPAGRAALAVFQGRGSWENVGIKCVVVGEQSASTIQVLGAMELGTKPEGQVGRHQYVSEYPI